LQALKEEMQAKTRELEQAVEELTGKLRAQEVSTAQAIADRDSVKRDAERQVCILFVYSPYLKACDHEIVAQAAFSPWMNT
jgi:hypothetical protein